MTVRGIASALAHCPRKPAALYITGGGRHNGFMMDRLRSVTGAEVLSVDMLGWSGDAMEAEGFAYMAVRHLLNEPVSYPTTTACHSPTVGGVFVKAKAVAA